MLFLYLVANINFIVWFDPTGLNPPTTALKANSPNYYTTDVIVIFWVQTDRFQLFIVMYTQLGTYHFSFWRAMFFSLSQNFFSH